MTRHGAGRAHVSIPGALSILALAFGLCPAGAFAQDRPLTINDKQYFEKRGLNVLVFTNEYNGMFFDEKTAGIEIIHHGVRTATGGAVRLGPTPEQWDQIPKVVDRKVDPKSNTIEVTLRYEAFDFDSRLVVTPDGAGFRIAVFLDKPVPAELEGRAGLNLEFVPSRYWERTYLVDGRPGIFPRYPAGPTTSLPPEKKIRQFEGHSTFDLHGHEDYVEALPVAAGKTLAMAPEDPERHVVIRSLSGELQLLDGRNLAQNGWYVVRTPLATKTTGKVAEWSVEPHTIPSWTRTPVIGFSQVGYHPSQPKRAVIELDANDTPLPTASLIEIRPDGQQVEKMKAKVEPWGRYLRYNYVGGRLLVGQGPGPLRHPVRDAEDRRVPDRGRRVRAGLAPDARRVLPGPDGPHARERGLPRVARRRAPRRRGAGALERAALRRLPDGRDDQHPVQAGRTDSGPGRGRLVRRGRLRHPGRVARDDGLGPRGDVGDVPAAARPDADRPGPPLRRHPPAGREAGRAAADRAGRAADRGPVPLDRPPGARHRRRRAAPVPPPRRRLDADRQPDLRPVAEAVPVRGRPKRHARRPVGLHGRRRRSRTTRGSAPWPRPAGRCGASTTRWRPTASPSRGRRTPRSAPDPRRRRRRPAPGRRSASWRS